MASGRRLARSWAPRMYSRTPLLQARIDPLRHCGRPIPLTPAALGFLSRIDGYCECFNARFRDELLDGDIFYNLREVQILTEPWRRHDNTKRPHSALDYRPPAPETIVPDGPKAYHALAIKLDHSTGADQGNKKDVMNSD